MFMLISETPRSSLTINATTKKTLTATDNFELTIMYQNLVACIIS